MRKIISIALVFSMLFVLASATFVTGGATETYDPANTYVPMTAPYEDSDISMWFQHANVKVFQEDTTPTGRNTYSVYMAKNEIQGTQVVLYTDVLKSDLTASCSEFTAMDESGATIPVSLYYEAYINCTDLDVTNVLGVNSAEESIIREGHIPDALLPVERLNKGTGVFSLGAGVTQTFLIRLKTALDTPSGWYSGTFELKNSDGNVIKTATVYAYVWDFEIPEETTYETAIYVDMGTSGETVYKYYYDYLLENRICAMNIPGEITSTNEYLDNPRVSSFRIANKGSYLGWMETDRIKAVYDDLSTRDDFDTLKEKIYFYTHDEPRSQQQKDYGGVPGSPVVGDCLSRYNLVDSVWPDPYTVVPFDENHPYPAGYSKTLAYNSKTGTFATENDGSFSLGSVKDAVQGIFDDGSVTVWCPKMCLYTPDSVARSVGYRGYNTPQTKVHTMNGVISGFDCGRLDACYFNWDTVYGSFQTRINNYRAEQAENGKNIKLWWYNCGKGPTYTYCNHVIENTGLQTELMFWQSMQVGSNGYLYYASNSYAENGTVYVDGTSYLMDGSMMSNKWRVNRFTRQDADGNDKYVYGNGVLFYGVAERSFLKLTKEYVLGTVRVEQMRDGIEDYEMLNMYRNYYGEEAMQAVISQVSDNVTCYLSLPGFDRSAWDSDMTSEDIFAQVRINLGNALEEAGKECTHEWDEGVVTLQPTYTETGIKTYTCAICGETYTEVIPVLDPMYGDIDGDGFVGTKDSKLIAKYMLGTVGDSDIVHVNADIDGDGIVGTKDAKALKKILLTI